MLIFENAIEYNFNYSIVAIDAKKLKMMSEFGLMFFKKQLSIIE
jgi:hypothetical protein